MSAAPYIEILRENKRMSSHEQVSAFEQALFALADQPDTVHVKMLM